MQTNPAVKQSKIVRWSVSPWNQSGRKGKGLWRKGFAEEPSLEFRMFHTCGSAALWNSCRQRCRVYVGRHVMSSVDRRRWRYQSNMSLRRVRKFAPGSVRGCASTSVKNDRGAGALRRSGIPHDSKLNRNEMPTLNFRLHI